jgi:hypothetical protein
MRCSHCENEHAFVRRAASQRVSLKRSSGCPKVLACLPRSGDSQPIVIAIAIAIANAKVRSGPIAR